MEEDFRNDKDVIIAKQHAYIAYLKKENEDLKFNIGQLESEVQYFESRIRSKDFSPLNKEIEKIKLVLGKKEKDLLEARQKKNIANYNFSLYKNELKKELYNLNSDTYIDVILEIEKKEKRYEKI